MEIEVGRYPAKPKQWGVTQNKKGNEQATIVFDVDVNGKNVEMTWFGQFNEGKAREITLKAIAACGCQDIAMFDHPTGLDKNANVIVTIEKETNEKGTFSKIKWVNSASKNKFETLVPPAQSKSFLKTLKADYAEVKKDMGAPTKKSAGPKGVDDDESIPF